MKMEYVLLERTAGQDERADVLRKVKEAGARVLQWRGRVGLVDFEGSKAELIERAGGLPGWLVSEKRTYRLLAGGAA
jgi:hypothetical protein